MSEQQVLKKIHIDNLKGIKDMDFNLGDKPVTGIFGPNGCGKSTILHVLLCLYKPKEGSTRTNYRYSDFFISVDNNKWEGSKLSYDWEFSEAGNPKKLSKTIHKVHNRWIHDYGERPDRDVFFIGIKTCVPDVETEKDGTIHLNGDVEAFRKAEDIIRIASEVMNFSYERCEYRKSSKKQQYISCRNGILNYLSLSMGAGEQRLFRILEIIVNAPKYSLIVIDEIDLTLHNAALKRLMNHVIRIANDKHLQVVFTSHRQELAERTDINIRHIVPSYNGGATLCLEQTTTACVERLTGERLRPIEVFVEDDVAKAVVEQIASELNIRKKVSVKCYGDISNAFRLISGLHLAGRLNSNIISVTDGDVYRSSESRLEQMKKTISGTEPDKVELRLSLLNQVLQFNLPEGISPDQYVHDSLILRNVNNDIVDTAKSIQAVYDNHQYINRIIEELGGDRQVELSRIISEFSKQTNEWETFTLAIRTWLSNKKEELGL